MTNLEKFRDFFRDAESPDHFFVWNYYFMVASALARRVWYGSKDPSEENFKQFVNIYLVFVAPPGIGKSIIANQCKRLLADPVHMTQVIKIGDKTYDTIPRVLIGPDSVTVERLWEYLGEKVRPIFYEEKDETDSSLKKKIYSHSSMTLYLGDEMGTMFREQSSQDLYIFLTKGWDCGDFDRQTKFSKSVKIKNMCLNLLGCCTPSWIKDNLSRRQLDEGFTARVIFVYGDKWRKLSPFINIDSNQKAHWADIREHLKKVTEVFGSLEMTPEAVKWYEAWYHANREAKPNADKVLESYYGRKPVHLKKVAALAHFAEKTDRIITREDFETAANLLTLTEHNMHKAICSKKTNLVAELADKIVELIEESSTRSLTYQQILAKLFGQGDMEQIKNALDYLMLVKQIQSIPAEAGSTTRYILSTDSSSI